ncbi:MAG TPA: hypothetical protein VG826_01175 [Pirellulales bacterium]|nr:hypothetical protein [Pirellulales bacterium]
MAIRALRQLARLQFLEGRSEEATATCRQVVDIGHHLRPPSRESVRELFAVAALLRKHGKMADAEFVISQAILGVSKPPTEKQ